MYVCMYLSMYIRYSWPNGLTDLDQNWYPNVTFPGECLCFGPVDLRGRWRPLEAENFFSRYGHVGYATMGY